MIQTVALTEAEQDLYSSLPSGDTNVFLSAMEYSERMTVLENMGRLTESLLSRYAVPKHRIDYFQVNVKHHFERNGTRDAAIYRHPDFINHLRYFIGGPKLPQSVIAGFSQVITDHNGTSGEVMRQLRSYTRAAVRKHNLVDARDAEQFFKLACELDRPDLADSVRNAAKDAARR